MVDILITSSVLILVICVIRHACMGRISRRLQYALWLIVVLRLLIPFSLFDNVYNYARLIKPAMVLEEQGRNPLENEPMEIPIVPDTAPVKKEMEKTGDEEVVLPQMPLKEEAVPAAGVALRTKDILKIIWCVGMGVCALVILTGNLVFYCRLRKERVEISNKKNVKIYQTNVFTTPCLYGFLHPSIYMTEESLADEERMELILVHEYTHYRHLDYIWSMVRCLCVCIYWFHPLVWLAAVLSERDSELACDESVLKQVGEERRGLYGQTVLELAAGNRGTGILYCATGMAGDKKELRERIMMIAGKNRVMIVVSVLVIAVMAVAFISAFGGRQSAMASTEDNQETAFGYNLKKSSVIEYEGVLYVLDKTDDVLLAVRPDTYQVETICDMEKSDLTNDIWFYGEQLYFVRGVKTEGEEMMQFQLETVRLSDYEHWVVCTLECATKTDFAFENGFLYYLCICPVNDGNIYTLHQVSVEDEGHQIVSYIMESGEQLMVQDGYCYYNVGGKLYQVKLAGGKESLIAENVYDYDLGASHIYYMVPDEGVYRADIKSGSVQLFYDGNLTKSHNFGIYVEKGEENILLYSKAVGINYLDSDGKLLNYNQNFVPAAFAGTEGITQNWFVCESKIGEYYLDVTPLNRLMEEDIIFHFTKESIKNEVADSFVTEDEVRKCVIEAERQNNSKTLHFPDKGESEERKYTLGLPQQFIEKKSWDEEMYLVLYETGKENGDLPDIILYRDGEGNLAYLYQNEENKEEFEQYREPCEELTEYNFLISGEEIQPYEIIDFQGKDALYDKLEALLEENTTIPVFFSPDTVEYDTYYIPDMYAEDWGEGKNYQWNVEVYYDIQQINGETQGIKFIFEIVCAYEGEPYLQSYGKVLDGRLPESTSGYYRYKEKT